MAMDIPGMIRMLEKFVFSFVGVINGYNQEYLNALEAPNKEYIAFANSAHRPNLEETAKFIEVFRKMTSVNPLKTQT
jgi:hypothetical protein